jgi:O-antigen ligase
MIGWDVLMNRVRARWWLLLILVVSLYVPLEIASTRSVAAIFIEKFAFDPWTAYYRLIIWDYGSASVMNNPIFGYGIDGSWDRPSWLGASVDMYWLIWAMQIGIPGAVFILLALGFMTFGAMRRKITDPKLYDYRLGFLIVMLGFFMSGWTVHYWNATHALFFFLLGSGGWILDIKNDNFTKGEKLETIRGRDIGQRRQRPSASPIHTIREPSGSVTAKRRRPGQNAKGRAK